MAPTALHAAHALDAPSVASKLATAHNATITTPSSSSADLFVVVIVSVFLFLAASILRLVPWVVPISSRPRLSAGRALAAASQYEPIAGFANFGYGTLAAVATDRHVPTRAVPTYEMLLEIEDRIGYAKQGLTEEQIAILPIYQCDDRDCERHERRGMYCAICRDLYAQGHTVSILPCGDEFHAACISPWLKQQATCPLCRCRFA
ncbi:unnamed protein product [Agarophyton chilense]